MTRPFRMPAVEAAPTPYTAGHLSLNRPSRRPAASTDPAPADPQPTSETTPSPQLRGGGVDRPTRQRTKPVVRRRSDGPRTGASNALINPNLIGPLEQLRAATNASNGEIIITAITETLDALPALIAMENARDEDLPTFAAETPLFTTRGRARRHTTDGPQAQLSYRLNWADFDTLDSLVRRFSARSRGQLISIALTEYFATLNPSPKE